MNGIKQKLIIVCALVCCTVISCLQVEEFVQETFVYEPYGEHFTIEQLKALPADNLIEREIYVQGVVTSSDESGQYAQSIVFQDESGAINIYADLSSSNRLFPIGQKISVQCRGMMLGEAGGMLSLGASVSGEGLDKKVNAIDNRSARNSIWPVAGGSPVEAMTVTLSELSVDSRSHEQELVCINDVFFQTADLPFANEGGSSEQYRTLYDDEGESILLCTSDAASMAGDNLPAGKGSVTGIVTYSNGSRIITARTMDDFNFNPDLSGSVNIPGDMESDIFISEYYASDGAYYIEVTNVGTTPYSLNEFTLASDTASDGEFTKTVALEEEVLGPFGVVIYMNSKASEKGIFPQTGEWDPYRANVSAVNIDGLSLDGNSQIALMKGGETVDMLSSTGKNNWAAERTLIRRTGVKGHCKPSDFTRADAGWVNKISGYTYDCGSHRFYETDPDTESPGTVMPETILNVRSLPLGNIASWLSITGRVTSDREGGNVEPNVLFMQDGSNRGIRVAFREGQAHSYDAGDEVTVELYGSEMTDTDGVLSISGAVISRSEKTASPNGMPQPVEASVSQIESLQSMYILIKDVQVRDEYTGQTYGAAPVGSEDLFANNFLLKCLPDAEFADSQVSQMSGTIKGIASKSGEDLVVLPRNNEDLAELQEPRFTAITATPVTVAQMKEYGPGVISDEVRVTGTVVSDNTNGNMPEGMLFVQDATDGFLLQTSGEETLEFGQSVIIVLTGATLSNDGNVIITPAEADDVVAVGAPDPSMQPVQTEPAGITAHMNMLVTISGMEVCEEDRLKKFEGEIIFNARGIPQPVHVVTGASAPWNGAYIPTAAGSVTGLVAAQGDHYVLYPRKTEDLLAALPENGTRLDGEKVVYFVPSTDEGADLFISETVMGDLDAAGALLASVARNKCNAKFVELYNPTGESLDLHNYRVACIKYNNAVNRSDISYWQFPEGLSLAPGKTVVFKYVSSALGTGTGDHMTNTLWPSGYTADQTLTEGVTVDGTSVPGVILCLDARDYSKSIANSTQSFPAFDGNDILVVQKTVDSGATWTEIDRLFSLPTADGTIGGKVTYPFLNGYRRKPGMLGHPGNVTDAAAPEYTALNDSKRNVNDFESIQCNPASGAVAEWNISVLGDVTDLGVHTFSVK